MVWGRRGDILRELFFHFGSVRKLALQRNNLGESMIIITFSTTTPPGSSVVAKTPHNGVDDGSIPTAFRVFSKEIKGPRK